VKLGPDGLARVVLKGRLSARTVVDCWNTWSRRLRGAPVKTLEVDVSGVDFCGGAGFALLRYLNMGKMTPGAKVSVVGLAAGFQNHLRRIHRAGLRRVSPADQKEPSSD
jgi:ABC-type transporter Mla MlaB component